MFQNIIKLFWHGMNLKICDSLCGAERDSNGSRSASESFSL